MTYQDYLNSEDWKIKKLEKLNRQKKKGKKPRCAICGYDSMLELHHLYYEKDLKDNNNQSLRYLCRTCHQTTHNLINEGILIYTNKNHNSRFALTKNAVKKRLGYGNKNLFHKIENLLDTKSLF